MEEFKKKIKFRFQLCTMFCCSGSLIFFILRHFIKDIPEFSQGMLSGFFVGMDLLCLIYMVRCLTLLHDEKKLKAEYIKSTDERNIAISKETMRTSSMICVMLTSLAAMIAGFFSVTVSSTLVVSLLAESIVTCLVQAYYNKKM